MRLVFLGSGWMNAPFVGTEMPAPDTIQATRRGSPAIVLQPNHPDPPTLLIDAAKDITDQWTAWPEAPSRPEAVIVTHAHFDHMGGLSDLAFGTFLNGVPPFPVYATERTLERLDRYAAVLRPPQKMFGLEPRALPERDATSIEGVEVATVPVNHDPQTPDTALLVRHRGRFVAHLSDTNSVVEDELREAIRGCDLLVVNTPFMDDTEYHIGVPTAVALAREVEAKRLVLTHINFDMSPQTLAEVEAENPWVTVAYDGLVVEVPAGKVGGE